MLEKPALVIRRGLPDWRIFDPDSGEMLGVARPRRTAGLVGIGWLGRSSVTVFEAGDEPLVMTVRRLWGFSRRWEVCDADDHRIAILHRESISDPSGYVWAFVEAANDEIRFRGTDREFAHGRKTAEAIHLKFGPEIQSNPLTKMSVLGAVLIRAE